MLSSVILYLLFRGAMCVILCNAVFCCAAEPGV